MTNTIQILSIEKTGKESSLQKEHNNKSIKIIDGYFFSRNLDDQKFTKISKLISNDVSQTILTKKNVKKVLSSYSNFNWVVEIKFLPGVTDNIATTVKEIIKDNLKSSSKSFELGSTKIILIKGRKEDITKISKNEANPLIQTIKIYPFKQYLNNFKKNQFKIEKVKLPKKKYSKKEINLDISDHQLSLIGKLGIEENDKSRRGTLGLDLESLKVIRDYFSTIKRKPTDVEIETLAQTWSEHCKHKIFSAKIDDIQEGIFKKYIKGATEKIIQLRKDNFCVSLFTDNAGGIEFNKDWIICHKVETHNTPSALDPFGGAITGIVGVNRDCLGFGKGAKPIANTYAYYLADPNKKYQLYRQKNNKDPMLPANFIAKGIISGVRVGGNCSGIPTPQGNVYFDDRFAGKPLVFCGTVGIIPKKIKGKLSHKKKANPGDIILMAGGRVGKDGIHGATFSSEELDPNSPVSAVQIGDPITQKKMSDVIIRELRDENLYSSITDNGAGGLSSSIGEMAKESGGFIVNLEKVPLKYNGLYPWEIWVSESQERMTLAVPPANVKKVIKRFNARGVEATIIGKFIKKDKAIVKYNKTEILNLDMEFLHEGYPKLNLKTSFPKIKKEKKKIIKKSSLIDKLHKLLSSPNIVSKEFIATQYDHEVQATSIIKPLQGEGRIFGNATAIKPLFDDEKSIALSQAAYPQYAETNPYDMAGCSIDTAYKNLIVSGANSKKIAILDNFCWCSSDEPDRLYQLKEAAKACYDYAVAYQTPFISGKDSMFNDFKGFDKTGKSVKISIPPTLLISSIGVVDKISHLTKMTPDEGDILLVLGNTRNELQDSVYSKIVGYEKSKNPVVNSNDALCTYRNFEKANKLGIINSAIGIDLGGIGIAVTKMAIASKKGLTIDLKLKNKISVDQFLFSETQSRILVSMKKNKLVNFKKIFKGSDYTIIGKCTGSDVVEFKDNKKIIRSKISDFAMSYKQNIKGL